MVFCFAVDLLGLEFEVRVLWRVSSWLFITSHDWLWLLQSLRGICVKTCGATLWQRGMPIPPAIPACTSRECSAHGTLPVVLVATDIWKAYETAELCSAQKRLKRLKQQHELARKAADHGALGSLSSDRESRTLSSMAESDPLAAELMPHLSRPPPRTITVPVYNAAGTDSDWSPPESHSGREYTGAL